MDLEPVNGYHRILGEQYQWSLHTRSTHVSTRKEYTRKEYTCSEWGVRMQ
jgi:hypothetical protein